MAEDDEAKADKALDDRDREHERRISWWSKVVIPLIAALVGFGAGLATCTSAYLQRDVRNQVWEATYQDKERVQQKQSELLKLQEEYLGKLKQIQDDQLALAKAQDDLKGKQAEAASAITSKPATCDRLKTGHFVRSGTAVDYFELESLGKLAA